MNAILRALAIVLALAAAPAQASFHFWAMNELYSSADGSIQFVELTALAGGQQFIAGHTLTASSGGNTNTFTFPSNLPGDTSGRRMLIATQGFAALGIVTPDYTVPNNFFFRDGGSVNFASGVDVWNHPALPTNNQSLDRSGASIPNSPTNFAGASGTVPPPALGGQRVFVASYGNDDANAYNGCRVIAPCRTFTTALSKVDAGGEVVALDAAGYGAVFINKSVTITTNPGYYAGITATSGAAITIDAPGGHVVLRGLNLNGLGATNGVFVGPVSSFVMENCVVANFSLNGIVIGSPTTARIVDTISRGNGSDGAGDGVIVGADAKATLTKVRTSGNGRAGVSTNTGVASITNSESSSNMIGYYAAAGDIGVSKITLSDSSASGNFLAGLALAGPDSSMAVRSSSIAGNFRGVLNDGGLFETYGDNIFRYNATPDLGTITLVPGQ